MTEVQARFNPTPMPTPMLRTLSAPPCLSGMQTCRCNLQASKLHHASCKDPTSMTSIQTRFNPTPMPTPILRTLSALPRLSGMQTCRCKLQTSKLHHASCKDPTSMTSIQTRSNPTPMPTPILRTLSALPCLSGMQACRCKLQASKLQHASCRCKLQTSELHPASSRHLARRCPR